MPNLRGNVHRHVNIRVRWLDEHGIAHDEVKRGLTAGTFQHECDHLDGVLFLDRVDRPDARSPRGSSSSASTATPSSSGSPSSSSASAPDPMAASTSTFWCELAWLGPGAVDQRDGVLVTVDGGRRSPPSRPASRRHRPAPRAARASPCPGSPTPTATPSTAPCAGAPHDAAGRSGRGASRCTRSPRRSIPTRTSAWRRRRSPRWCSPATPCVGEFHYLHHDPAACPTPTPTRSAGGCSPPPPTAGIRITLLDTCYLHGGFGVAPERRCSGGSATARPTRGPSASTALADGARPRAGSAPPSTPCAPSIRSAIAAVAGWAERARRRAARPRVRAAGGERPTASPPTGARRSSCSPRHGALDERFTRRARDARHVARHRAARRRPRRVLHLPDDRARPRRRDRTDGGARDAGVDCASDRTRMP